MIVPRLAFLPVALAFEFDLFEPVLKNLTVSGDLSCRRDSQALVHGLDNGSFWAVRMWDSSAKSTTGWVSGNQAQFGNFDECLGTDEIRVQYCLGRVKIRERGNAEIWKRVHVKSRVLVSREEFWAGFCVPASCGVSDLGFHGQNWDVKFSEEFCTVKDTGDEPISASEIGFWSISAFLVVSVITATVCDVYLNFSGWKAVKSLSLRQNFNILIAPATNPDHPLAILHGLRVAAVILVVYAHRLGIPFSFSAFNQERWEDNLKSLAFRFSAQADMTVDTFFVLSGILMGFFSAPLFPFYSIINRILRLSPVYLWVVWLEGAVVPRMGSGPLWNAVQKTESEFCSRNWWLNAVFLQNYVNDAEMCLTHTWYIPCEMHFFILALVLRSIVRLHQHTGLVITNFLMVVAVIVPGVVTWILDLDPLVLFYLPDFLANPRSNKTFLEVYSKSHNRLGVYLIGLLCGLYLAEKEKTYHKRNMKKSLGFLFASLIMFAIPMVYGIRFYDPSSFRFAWEAALFTILRRPIWALGIWFLILSHRAYPIPILGNVLSCRAAVVLSRLTYGLYLIHFPIIMANMAKTRSAPVFNWFDVIFSGDLASSFIFSTLMFLFIESPVRNFLSWIIFGLRKNNNNIESSTNETRVPSV